jgi:predicted dehydrogenase
LVLRKLRMGIIGTGLAFEQLHYPAYQRLADKYEIAAICDIDAAKLEKWKDVLGLSGKDRYTDFHEMLQREDIDAFDIMLPIELNFTVTEEVAKAGKPIICEKPLAPNRQEALKARKLPRLQGVPIMIAENYRYSEEHNIMRDLVRTREVGDVYYFIQNRVVDFPADMRGGGFAATEWRQHPEYPGGVFLDTGVHDIAALRHIFGPIDAVHAFGVEEEEWDFAPFSVIQANLKFKSGVLGHLSFFCTGREMQRPLIGLRIFGSEGMIYHEESGCGTVNVAYNDGGSKQIPYEPNLGFYNELLNFYKAAAGEEPLSVTPELEYGDVLTVFDILDAARHNRVVQVDHEVEYEPAY